MPRRCSVKSRMESSLLTRILKISGASLGLMGTAGIFLWLFFSANLPAVPSFQEVRQSYAPSEAVLRDRHGTIIHELRVNFSSRSLEWTDIAGLSPVLTKAVVLSEDKRFYDHHGTDFLAIAGAALGRPFKTPLFFSGRMRGASTITMQVASFLNKTLEREGKKRTISQKWRQMRTARAIEKKWSKAQILEAYLNLVDFKGELKGITAASRGLFDKAPSGLNSAESLILACLIRAPNASAQAVSRRASRLASAMQLPQNSIPLTDTVHMAIFKPYAVRQQAAMAPHVAYQLLDAGAKDVKSTIDRHLQAFAQAVLIDHLRSVKDQNVNDGALIVLDNKTGEILAYLGNSGADSSASYVDGVRARRQAGSTLKPFLYGLAIDTRVITAASLLEDSPLDVTTEKGIYRPENYDKQFKGLVPARVALASSLNVPAVRVLMLTGTERFVEKLRDLGFSDLRDGDFYGYSLALGSFDVSLFEMANAFRTLANVGLKSEVTFLPGQGIKTRTRVFSREAAYIVADILSDRQARSVTFGLENALATPFWSAAKTGTSKDMRDNWCVGFSRDYTVGVWVGNFGGSAMWDVSGVTGAAPIWQEIMNYLHKAGKSGRPPAPPGVVRLAAAGDQGSAKSELFIAGTESAVVAHARSVPTRLRITYPPDDATLAYDPDIPEDVQRVFFKASGNVKDARWLLNGEEIGHGSPGGWALKGGTYHLALMGANNRPSDEVRFVVKE
jgi:penicillin-binding protein 1C